MTTAEKIEHINQVLQEYFDRHPSSLPIPVKDFMPRFIKAGLFSSEKTLRQFLRDLRDSQSLHRIPFVLAEQKVQNTSWFFGPARTDRLIQVRPAVVTIQKTKPVTRGNKPRNNSDECYVLDLCDEVLGLSSVRQHRFPFLVGDPNSAGRCTRLPVDAWYESINLVIEFNEKQHTEPVKHFDKRMTLSGVHRGEQRAIYDHRKRNVLPTHGIQVLTFPYSDFSHDSRKRLIRDKTKDLKVIIAKLARWL